MSEAPHVPDSNPLNNPHPQEYRDNLMKARELAINGLDSEAKEDALDFAKKSLAVSEDCAEAYILLGSRKAPTFLECLEFSQKAKAAGKRAIGGDEAFEAARGRFYESPETVSYLRGLEAEANIRWMMGDIEGSVNAYREMVELNPNDDQNAKHPLSDGLIRLRQFTELADLMKRYPDEEMSWLNYNYALMLFTQHGPSEEATAALHRAVDINPFVPIYILGKKAFPEYPPGVEKPGTEEEAIVYGMTQIKEWRRVAGYHRWLRHALRNQPTS